MKKISFFCKKGGVGKTSLSVNVAHYLSSKFQKKTILIDADPQGNATEGLTSASSSCYQLIDVLQGAAKVRDVICQYDKFFYYIKTIGFGSKLREDSDLVFTRNRLIFLELNNDLKNLGFEFVFYDMSPNFEILEKSISISLDEIIAPFIPEKYGISGLNAIVNDIKFLNKNEQSKVKLDKVILNNINSSLRSHTIVSELIKEMQYKIYSVPQDSKVKDSQLLGKAIYEIFPKTKSVIAYHNIARDIIKEIQ